MTDAPATEIEEDLGIYTSRYLLWIIGATYAAVSFVAGPYFGVSVIADPEVAIEDGPFWGGVVAVGTILVGLGLGYAHFTIAWGLAAGKRWAWWATLLVAGVAVFQCCPIAVLFLWAMLNDRTRRLFLGGRLAGSVDNRYQFQREAGPP